MTWKVTFVQVGISQFFKECDPFVLYSLSLSMQFYTSFDLPHIFYKRFIFPHLVLLICVYRTINPL